MMDHDIVLVVDDMPGTLSMLTDALEHAGMTTLVAQDGPQALLSASRVTPDIVLMDAVMPLMDGFETCRKIKALPRMSEVPVVFMTGLSKTEHVVQGFEAGGVDYVTKPIIPKELLARIRVHLANSKMMRSARLALDATGRYLLAVDRSGHLLWMTPQAESCLAQSFPQNGETIALPQDTAGLFQRLVSERQSVDGQAILLSGTFTGTQVRVAYISQVGDDEFLLRLIEGDEVRDEDVLRQRLKLTTRESEVLLWLAHGKSNRDIAAILGLSPRTIDKHLEQVYAKLGVENRTSAASMAMQALTDR